MKLEIVWLEYTDKEGKELKEFMKTLSNPKYTGGELGGTEIECFDTFEAETIEEAKKKVKKDFFEVEIFTVLDENNNRVFTEEDLEEVE